MICLLHDQWSLYFGFISCLISQWPTNKFQLEFKLSLKSEYIKGVILDFGQKRPVLENQQILNRSSKIDSDFFNRTPDAPKRAWTTISWQQRRYRFLSADKQLGHEKLRWHITGATVDRFWWDDYHFDGNDLKNSFQVIVLRYIPLEDRKSALSWKVVF